jgi:hypothetical protein
MEERGGRVIVGREGRIQAVDFDACDDDDDDDDDDDVDGGGGCSFSAIDFFFARSRSVPFFALVSLFSVASVFFFVFAAFFFFFFGFADLKVEQKVHAPDTEGQPLFTPLPSSFFTLFGGPPPRIDGLVLEDFLSLYCRFAICRHAMHLASFNREEDTTNK